MSGAGAPGGGKAGEGQVERKKKESILDLAKFMDKQVGTRQGSCVRITRGCFSDQGEVCRGQGVQRITQRVRPSTQHCTR